MASFLPYHEPDTVQIAILASFFLALNIVNSVLDRSLYCGLIGQVLVGVAWGRPAGDWLSDSLQEAIVQIGYLGLILIVYEGGIETSVGSGGVGLLLLSLCVAATGVAAPMALSFALGPSGLLAGGGATAALQSFAAGAALCSTSLGTTFAVLQASGLASSRLGSVLAGAAMMDDVVGLVMAQVISSLGGGGGAAFEPATVLRPVLVSFGIAALVPLVLCYAVRPLVRRLLLPSLAQSARAANAHTGGASSSAPPPQPPPQPPPPPKALARLLPRTSRAAAVVHTLLLLAVVVGAGFAGASPLLAAYLAGVAISFFDGEVERLSASLLDEENSRGGALSSSPSTLAPPSQEISQPVKVVGLRTGGQGSSSSSQGVGTKENKEHDDNDTTGRGTYARFLSREVSHVLKPLFFASIGFSIPVSRMFSGQVVWRGIVYSILMVLAKLFCGVWVAVHPLPRLDSAALRRWLRTAASWAKGAGRMGSQAAPLPARDAAASRGLDDRRVPGEVGQEEAVGASGSSGGSGAASSLFPPALVSFAMVARGEIGFLISSVAESKGVFRSPAGADSSVGAGAGEEEVSETFLVVTWAIVLCTIIGPLCTGALVRQVRKLDARLAAQARGSAAAATVLGVWGKP